MSYRQRGNICPSYCFDTGHYDAMRSYEQGTKSRDKSVRKNHHSYDDCWEREQETRDVDELVISPTETTVT